MKCPKCKSDNADNNKFCSNCVTALFDIPATLTSPLPPKKEEAHRKSDLDFAPGQYFGKRYQIIEEIGRGGMGKVYKALDRVVVLKMTKPELSSKPGIVKRFKKEITLASQISHEHVCRIHDLGEINRRRDYSLLYLGVLLAWIKMHTAYMGIAKTVNHIQLLGYSFLLSQRYSFVYISANQIYLGWKINLYPAVKA